MAERARVKPARPASPAPRKRRLRRWLLWLALAPMIFSFLWVLLYRWVDPPLSGVMAERIIEARRAGNSVFRIDQQWCALDSVGPYLPVAIVAAEDQRFLEHSGFDTVEIEKALAAREDGARLRGASTLSQQVAKNVFLWSGRSYLRKGLEAWFTVLIELLWNKERILEVYLNVAETGDGLFGFCRACEVRFGKDCERLSPYQLALLVATLPNPRQRRADKPTAYLHQRASWIVKQSEQLGGPAWLQRMRGE